MTERSMPKEGFIEIIIPCLHLGVKDSASHGKVKKKVVKKALSRAFCRSLKAV